MKEIVSIQRKERNLDVNEEFRFYKYAIPEHAPIKLSNGMWLHTYRLTPYDPDYDIDEEIESINNML